MTHTDEDSMIKGHIPTEAWKPSHREFDYPKDFTDWIDSINSGWQNKKIFQPFTLYCKQADQWPGAAPATRATKQQPGEGKGHRQKQHGRKLCHSAPGGVIGRKIKGQGHQQRGQQASASLSGQQIGSRIHG